MKMHISLSMPILDNEPQFESELNDPVFNRNVTAKFVAVGRPEEIFGHTFYKTRSKYESKLCDSMILVENEAALLWTMVRQHHNDVLDRNTLVCLAAWSDRNNTSTLGLMRRIYLEHYLPMYGVLESSDSHRPAGAKMWHKLVGEALAKHLHVYAYTVEKQLIEITSVHQLEELNHLLWGETKEFELAKIFIAKTALDKLSKLPSFAAVADSITTDLDSTPDAEEAVARLYAEFLSH